MDQQDQTDPVVALALAWQPAETRPALAALFALDRRLGLAVTRAKEPMLVQVRLAWWRERLAEPPDRRPVGEPLLAELNARWGAAASKLVALVDGWEHLLGEAPLADTALRGFAGGRGEACASFAALADCPRQSAAAAAAGRYWAYAELAGGLVTDAERVRAVALGRDEPALAIHPRALRGLAVLGGLSRRSLVRGEPLMSGRGAAAAAMRLGMFGR